MFRAPGQHVAQFDGPGVGGSGRRLLYVSGGHWSTFTVPRDLVVVRAAIAVEVPDPDRRYALRLLRNQEVVASIHLPSGASVAQESLTVPFREGDAFGAIVVRLSGLGPSVFQSARAYVNLEG
jgi:hypothetical protein